MKVLMVGMGGIGQRHVRNLRSLIGPGLEIIAYRTRRLRHVVTERLEIEPAADVEEKYGIQAYSDLDEALAQKPEIVFICNPTSFHVPVALSAVRAGCHLFVEKPLSNNYEGIEDLITSVERQKLLAMVGYQMRFHPCLRLLADLLEQRVIGRPVAARIEVGEYLPGFHGYEDYRDMYAARRNLGGGVILTQIHELDMIYWLFGLPRRLFALGGHLSNLEIDVEDTASILMECVVEGKPLPVHLHQDYLQRPPSRTCQIIGDSGKILVDLRLPVLRVFDRQGNLVEEKEFKDFQRNQLFLDEMKHFLACLRGGQKPVTGLGEAANSLRMALAAKESLETGKVVELK